MHVLFLVSIDPSSCTLIHGFPIPLAAVLRGDIARLERCTEITTSGPSDASTSAAGGCGSGGGDEEVDEVLGGSGIKRSKPFKYAYEKEIVM